MSPERLLKYFEEISEAPDAVLRLRRFFWDLAVRGKLVEQDPKDEPAAVLLKQIETEKKGSINRSKGATIAMQAIRIDKMPFDLPYGWLWLRFGAIHDLVRGVTYSKNDVSEEPTPEHLPILRANNIGPSLNFEDLVFVRKECIGPDQFLRQGDYMIALSSGSKNLVGKAAYAEEDFKGGFGGFCGVIRLSSPLLRPYTGIFLSSHLYRDALSEGSRGIGINNLKKETLSKVLFPLPPLAEQHRIVAKVDELTALCDELEMAKQKRERRRDRLVVAALNGLNNGDTIPAIGTHSTFKESARFYFNHLPRLTTRPEHIQQLRQTILNLAIRGKLVPQDPNDESAEELLKRIESAKQHLIKQGRIRKQEPPTELGEDEVPFQIPESWEWIRAGQAYDVRDGTHDTPRYVEVGVPLVTSKNLRDGTLNLTDVKFISEKDHEEISRRSLVEKGDVLFAMIGTIGNPVVVRGEPHFSIKNVALFKYYSQRDCSADYLRYSLHHFSTEMADRAAGGLQPFVSLKFLRDFCLPLPPLAEQHRIVAKVDELMLLCDELKARLSTTATTRRQLLEATLHDALNDKARITG